MVAVVLLSVVTIFPYSFSDLSLELWLCMENDLHVFYSVISVIQAFFFLLFINFIGGFFFLTVCSSWALILDLLLF